MTDVIENVVEFTNRTCMNNPKSMVPVFAKGVIRFLKLVAEE